MTESEPRQSGIRLDVALIHYPVCNRNGEVIGSAVTNLDIHDIARASRTFGVDSYFLVTPFTDQQQLAREIIDHWLTGYGSRNRARQEALSLVRICSDLAELYAAVTAKWGRRPTVLATSAGPAAGGGLCRGAGTHPRRRTPSAPLRHRLGVDPGGSGRGRAQLPPVKGGVTTTISRCVRRCRLSLIGCWGSISAIWGHAFFKKKILSPKQHWKFF